MLVGAPAGGSPHFQVAASFVAPAKGGGKAAVAVTFVAKEPDLNVNEDPPPRLKLDPAQRVLVDRQPPGSTRPPVFDPDNPRYLDLRVPVLFPVAIAPGAPKGPHKVKASVVYFYCSKREGWCRRGTADIEVRTP
jgi:hypothetical protein